MAALIPRSLRRRTGGHSRRRLLPRSRLRVLWTPRPEGGSRRRRLQTDDACVLPIGQPSAAHAATKTLAILGLPGKPPRRRCGVRFLIDEDQQAISGWAAVGQGHRKSVMVRG